MYIDPKARQNFKFATLISWGNNPQNVKELDLDNDEHYAQTAKPVLRITPVLLEPERVQFAIYPDTFTAQEAGIYSNPEITKFSNRVSFTKHPDTATMLSG